MRTKDRTFCERISLLLRIAVLRIAVEVTSTTGKGLSEESLAAASDSRRCLVYDATVRARNKKAPQIRGAFRMSDAT
jgi:hypothetical protein